MKTKILFKLLLSLLLFTSNIFPQQQINSNENSVLKIMSFNIRYGTADDGENSWDLRKDLLFETVKKFHPAILCLQEALHFQLKEILSAIFEYDMVGVGRDDGKINGEYSAILFLKNRFFIDTNDTFWFSETPEIPGSKTWGNDITRICTFARLYDLTARRYFYTFNVHLDHISQRSREKSVILLCEKINDREFKDPVILTGDFNSGESNPALLYMKGEPSQGEVITPNVSSIINFSDTFRKIHPEKREVGTFNDFMGIKNGEKIDYIFYTGNFEVIDADIVQDSFNGRYPSDHFPVTAVLMFNM